MIDAEFKDLKISFNYKSLIKKIEYYIIKITINKLFFFQFFFSY